MWFTYLTTLVKWNFSTTNVDSNLSDSSHRLRMSFVASLAIEWFLLFKIDMSDDDVVLVHTFWSFLDIHRSMSWLVWNEAYLDADYNVAFHPSLLALASQKWNDPGPASCLVLALERRLSTGGWTDNHVTLESPEVCFMKFYRSCYKPFCAFGLERVTASLFFA